MKNTTEKKKKITKKESEAFAFVGRRGGKATFKKYGKGHMSEIGKRGAEKRWAK